MDHREYKGKSVDRLGRSCLECAAHFFCLGLNADFRQNEMFCGLAQCFKAG